MSYLGQGDIFFSIMNQIYEVQPIFWEIHLFTIFHRSISISSLRIESAASGELLALHLKMGENNCYGVYCGSCKVYCALRRSWTQRFKLMLENPELIENKPSFHPHFQVGLINNISLSSSLYALFSLPACKCNGHASVCQVLTGKCFCTTKGIKGDQCQLWVLRPHTHTHLYNQENKKWIP